MSAAPLIARKKLEGEDQYHQALQKIFRLCLISSIAVSVAVFFMAESLSLLLYGESYRETGSILKIHVFSNIPIFMGVARGLWTTNEGRQAFVAWCTIAGAFIAISVNLALIPKFGVLGAAATAVLSQFVSAVLSSIFVSKRVFMMQIGLGVK
jgi:PST family polysaccharide transporter